MCKSYNSTKTKQNVFVFSHIALYYCDVQYQPDYWSLPDVTDSSPMTHLQALKETFQWLQTKTDSLKPLFLA